MSKRIPIKAAKQIAAEYSLKQVILLAWDGERTHVVTYGKSVEDCDQAAQGGNTIKKLFKWPKELCNAEPSRVRKLKQEIKKLNAEPSRVRKLKQEIKKLKEKLSEEVLAGTRLNE